MMERDNLMRDTLKDRRAERVVTAKRHGARLISQIPESRVVKIRSIKIEELEFLPAEIDLKKLERAGTVKLHGCKDTAGLLVDLVKDYFNFRDVSNSEKRRLRRLLLQRKRRRHLPTYKVPGDLLAYDYMKPRDEDQRPRLRRRRALSVLIKDIEEILMTHDRTYGRKAGTEYD